jgi:uncharacterized protein YcaQ
LISPDRFGFQKVYRIAEHLANEVSNDKQESERDEDEQIKNCLANEIVHD